MNDIQDEKTRSALTLIAGFRGLTLIAPSLGRDGDLGHQLGANKAFNQAAEIAIEALQSDARREVPNITDEMVDRALKAWFSGSQSETDQGLERSMKAALAAAFGIHG